MSLPQHLYWEGKTKYCCAENPRCTAKAQWIVHYDNNYLFMCRAHYKEWISEGFGDE